MLPLSLVASVDSEPSQEPGGKIQQVRVLSQALESQLSPLGSGNAGITGPCPRFLLFECPTDKSVTHSYPQRADIFKMSSSSAEIQLAAFN